MSQSETFRINSSTNRSNPMFRRGTTHNINEQISHAPSVDHASSERSSVEKRLKIFMVIVVTWLLLTFMINAIMFGFVIASWHILHHLQDNINEITLNITHSLNTETTMGIGPNK